jgi:hypothetical protein
MKNSKKYIKNDVIILIYELLKYVLNYYNDNIENPFYKSGLDYLKNHPEMEDYKHCIEVVARTLDVYFLIYQKRDNYDICFYDENTSTYFSIINDYIIMDNIYQKYIQAPNYPLSYNINYKNRIHNINEIYPEWLLKADLDLADLNFMLTDFCKIIDDIEPYKVIEFESLPLKSVKEIHFILEQIHKGYEYFNNIISSYICNNIVYNNGVDFTGFADDILNEHFIKLKTYSEKKSLLNNSDNPIKENRIVFDITFATKLNNFLKNRLFLANDKNDYYELQYLRSVANMLLNYQKQTATDKDEITYLTKYSKR